MPFSLSLALPSPLYSNDLILLPLPFDNKNNDASLAVFTASGDLKDFHFKRQKSLAAGRPLMPCFLAPDGGMYRSYFSTPAEAFASSTRFGKEDHTNRSYTMTLSMLHFLCWVFHVANYARYTCAKVNKH